MHPDILQYKELLPPGLLAILFITLKLTGVITWSWLWVLAPIWIPFVIIVFILASIVIIANK